MNTMTATQNTRVIEVTGASPAEPEVTGRCVRDPALTVGDEDREAGGAIGEVERHVEDGEDVGGARDVGQQAGQHGDERHDLQQVGGGPAEVVGEDYA